MKELVDKVKSSRQKNPKFKDPKRYVSCWTEKELLDSEIVDSFIIILRTRGCGWAQESGCSMCGYINDAAHTEVTEGNLFYQFQEAMKKYSEEKIIKIYNSGSFFDENEISKPLQDKILNILFEKAEKVVVETRPEFVNEERLSELSKLEIAIGLESANDFVLKNSINKGFLLKDFTRAAGILNKLDIPIRTYLLIKPPYLFEKDAITDAIRSAKIAARHSQIISFNPVNIQKFTLVERLWKNREYRPPWLWSVVEVLRQSSELSDVRLISSPTAGGTKKGAHNCGKCDSEILKNIEEFSLTQDSAFLDELHCDCKNDWQDILSTQCFTQTQGDLFRLV